MIWWKFKILETKKLIKKFNYEIVFEKIFKNEMNKNSMDGLDSKKTALTAVVKQGLENLLVNL